MTYKHKTFSYDLRVRIFRTLVAVMIISTGLYVYGVSATVRNTLVRKNLESEASTLSASIGDREYAYIALTDKVDLASAAALGYMNEKNPLYVSRVPALSMNTVLHP